YGAAMHEHQILDDGQPQPKTSLCTLDGLTLLHEQVEHRLEHLRLDPLTTVLHAHDDVASDGACRQRDTSFRVAILGGIRQEIREYLRQTLRIPVDVEACGWNVDDELLLLLLEQGAGSFDRLSHDAPHIQVLLPQFHFAACDTRNVEKVVD